MTLTTFKELDWDIINVACVPQRSPFRYPGGKTWFVPYLRKWLRSSSNHIHEFIEPFAGGGIISLTVAFEKLADRVTMVELDDQVASVWKTIFCEDGEWLAEEITKFDFNVQAIETVLAKTDLMMREKAFQTILRNRINRGGILAPGAGRIKNGEKGKGIASRWYPETLKKRILDIVRNKDSITFVEGDGLHILRQSSYRTDAFFFIDPPYTAAGKKSGQRLYKCSQLNHEELFRITSKLQGKFLMTYDDSQEIRQLAHLYNFEVRNIAMKSSHHKKMNELLIGRNLDWLTLF
ncbi:MAG: DNA adenine methylase [Blastocatellia bacterium]|nr:DNA adenine methylase [Blastocatellia bacterium]